MKFERNQDLVFKLPILKAVIPKIEGNGEVDGESLYTILTTIGEWNNTSETNVAFRLNWSSNAMKIGAGYRMTLKVWMELQMIIWFFIFAKIQFQLHGHDSQIMMTRTKKFCTFNWTRWLMCTTNFQPWRPLKTSEKKMYSMNMWMLLDTARGTSILRRLTNSNFGTTFWCCARTRKNGIMPV